MNVAFSLGRSDQNVVTRQQGTSGDTRAESVDKGILYSNL